MYTEFYGVTFTQFSGRGQSVHAPFCRHLMEYRKQTLACLDRGHSCEDNLCPGLIEHPCKEGQSSPPSASFPGELCSVALLKANGC